ncbi:AAA family ATPase [Candidatus Oscillochloris fontis]|uniref:AAA family ATPase n=1 Tax=Candidatus Oscillochloris fontis TaxID=2496868 RepID=UPI00101D7AD0|nr:AAA family ATPase [Candidatus Oscillochloris fontis]
MHNLFVNRQQQLEHVRRSLAETSSRRIIRISAGPGMGKSWLLRRFAQDAAEHRVRRVLLDLRDGHAYDVLSLVRSFRDQLGSDAFHALTMAINAATAPRIGPGRDDHAPQATTLRDNLLIIQADNPLVMQAIEKRITQVFFACLQELERHGPILFLFDSYEHASSSTNQWLSNLTDRWITTELLTRIRDGQLRHTVVVLAGRRVPSFGNEWDAVTGLLPVGLFSHADVAYYLREKRGLTMLSDADIAAIFTLVRGHPQLLAMMGDTLVRLVDSGASYGD